MKPTKKILKQLTEKIVTLVHPKRIILFGSAARGEMGKHSDLDVLVVVRNGVHRNRTCDRIYRRLWGFDFATDIVVVTEEDVLCYRDNPYMVIHWALVEGRQIYSAA